MLLNEVKFKQHSINIFLKIVFAQRIYFIVSKTCDVFRLIFMRRAFKAAYNRIKYAMSTPN